METPSSVRKAPQSLIASYKTKQEPNNNNNKPDRNALIDITNDSPIVGLATATGSNFFTKTAGNGKVDSTPGSGEAILRSQVKNLLQKIEEEIELAPKIPSFPPRHHLLPPQRTGILELERSPMQMLAPTPANTPQIVTEDVQQGFLLPPPKIVSPIVHHEEPLGSCVLNRALLFDSPDKHDNPSISSITFSTRHESSSVTSNGSFTISSERHSSIWSTQANPGTDQGDDTESEFELEELCRGMKGMKFEGKHTRFVYGSDGEMEAEECDNGGDDGDGKLQSVVVLKGLPVPEGKHLRFQDEEDEEGEN